MVGLGTSVGMFTEEYIAIRTTIAEANKRPATIRLLIFIPTETRFLGGESVIPAFKVSPLFTHFGRMLDNGKEYCRSVGGGVEYTIKR